MTPDDLVEISWSFENCPKSNQKNIKISYSFNGKNWYKFQKLMFMKNHIFGLYQKI